MNKYNFPQELVENIFARLPLRSLSRFRCLSKQSSVALSDSNKFISSHDFFLQYIDYVPGRALSRLRIPTSFDAGSGAVEAVDVECPIGTSNEEIERIAHCNGILCMFNHTYLQPGDYVPTILVWNPLTMEHKRFQLADRGHWEGFGFGYDASINDYKIIHIAGYQPVLHPSQWRNINILRMKTDQWSAGLSNSDHLPYWFSISEKNRVGTAVDGCIYWIARTCVHFVILCFELETETLRKETPPCNRVATSNYDSNMLGVFEGSLCLIIDADCIHFDMWVMEENGATKTKSWIKLFKIQKVVQSWIDTEPVHPILSFHGQILIDANRRGFFLFNPKDGLIGNIPIHGLRYPDARFDVIPYVESLVSLNA